MNYEEIYTRNLSLIKEYSDNLFDKVVNQDISDLELVINNDKSYNIMDGGSMIYPKDTKEAINSQVTCFLDNPGVFYHKVIRKNENGNVSKFTNKIVNRILEVSPVINEKQNEEENYYTPKKIIPYLIVFGVGTGEYLNQILSKKEVLNLIIVDKDYSFFKLSMHLIDWSNIFDKFIQRPNSFIFLTGEKAETLAYTIINHIYAHNSIYTFYIQYLTHLSTPFFKDIVNIISNNMFHAINGWGFFEDEKISLQHTLTNLKNTTRIYNQKKSMNTQVLIIGSGPSLDSDIENIKEIQDKVFIISCGTALRTLWKYDIYPDLHIEIERNLPTFNALQYIDKNYLNKITLVGLNVLHPNVKKLFKEFYLIARDNDAGASLLKKTIYLDFTNPTVVNAGVNLAFSLDFKEIYLLGVDNGFKNPTIHHSKNNIHSDEQVVDFKYKIKEIDYVQDKIKGNFEDEVFTNSTFLWSKQRIENCISSFKKIGSKSIVYNCSDGAFIKNTITKKFDQKDFLYKKDISKLTKNFQLINHKKYLIDVISELENSKIVFEDVITKINNCLENQKINNSEDIYILLDETYQIINRIKERNQITFSFLSGSIKIIYSYIYSHSLSTKNEEEKIFFIKEAILRISEFLNYAYYMYLKIINNKNNFKIK